MDDLIFRACGVHDGSFHADEVTACSLLLLFDLIDIDKIYRTRDPKILNKCEYVCDVGGLYEPSQKRFDHHQIDYKGKMSSAGMILKYLKDQNRMSDRLYDYFNNSLILGVDAHDIGKVKIKVGFCVFSDVIANFLPVEYTSSMEEKNRAFYQALEFTSGHLKRLQKRYYYTQSCREIVKMAMEKDENYLFFDKAMAWMESFFELGGENHKALYVIMPTEDCWKLRGIPPSLKDKMKTRLPLPQKWAGLHSNDLEKVSNIPGAVFCHKGRFISIWKTKDAALQALDYILKKEGIVK